MEVDERMLGELEAMGFSKALAAKALTSSGNSSIEDAINWVVDHGDDVPTSEPSPGPEVLENIIIEASLPIQISEQVKLRAQELRGQARKRRAERDARLDRQREKERIRTGKELLEAKRMAEESERKSFRLLSQRKADKEEEKRARERIRQKLQHDKLERQRMLGLPMEVPASVNTELPQQTNNPEQVDPAALPEMPASARECMRECLRTLKHQNKDDNTRAMRAFQTLLIYVKNVFKDPDEEKFRKIRISNPAFQERVGRFEEGVKFLELCGFERVEGDNFLFMARERVDRSLLKSAAAELHKALTNPFFGLFSS
ncbi:UBX domain-containing protein 1-like [Salvia splendens]|uniref:UBX domain-containing protein 1-like n=1 Tax=Salvia splendens TaxID=180675 RepID=UPI0011029FE5|nr:UBX domain-containing protein 1-like [Salvia splendens]